MNPISGVKENYRYTLYSGESKTKQKQNKTKHTHTQSKPNSE